MSLKLITPATELAVSLATAKAHLRETETAEDDNIELMIRSSVKEAEGRTGRSFMRQTWLLTLEAFPGCIHLSRIPVASVVSIKYVDSAGVLQTLDPAAYSLYAMDDHNPAKVVPAYGLSWPSTRCQLDAVQVEYLAGVEDPADVPPEAAAWILLQVGAKFTNREAEGAVQTYALGFADRLLDGIKVYGQ